MEPNEDQLRENLKLFGKKLSKSLEEFLGKRYRFAKGVDKAQLHLVFKMTNDFLNLDWDTMDLGEVKVNANRLFKEATKINRNKPIKQHPIDLVIHIAELFLNPPREGSSLSNTKFKQYRQAAFEIAKKVQDVGKVQAVIDLYESMPEKYLNEFGNHAQRLSKQFALLEKRYVRIDARVIDRYWTLYFEMCVHLERIVRLLMGVNMIINGKCPTYEELEKKFQSFGPMVRDLKQIPHFKELLEPIEPIIKNAKSHGRRILIESEQKVIFNDKGEKSLALSFHGFVEKTRETAAAMIVASHVDSAIILPDLERVRDFLKS